MCPIVSISVVDVEKIKAIIEIITLIMEDEPA